MEYINALSKLDYGNFFIALLTIVGGIVLISQFIKKFCEIFGIEFKWLKQKNEDHETLLKTIQKLEEITIDSNEHDQKLEESINRIEILTTEAVTRIEILEKSTNANRIASREALADRINQKYKQYIDDGGIPEDEYDEFTSLHAAYKGVGGNHTGDAKFEYCINNLKIIPTKIKLDYGKTEE